MFSAAQKRRSKATATQWPRLVGSVIYSNQKTGVKNELVGFCGYFQTIVYSTSRRKNFWKMAQDKTGKKLAQKTQGQKMTAIGFLFIGIFIGFFVGSIFERERIKESIRELCSYSVRKECYGAIEKGLK